MYHSITFKRKDAPSLVANTWDTWHLIPTSRPVIAVPPPRTNFVEIPGASGNLDLSRAITPYPLYNNRSGSLEFAVDNDFLPWQVLYQKLLAFFQGYTMEMTLEDDPDFYYEGLFALNEWKSNNDGTWSVVKLDYQCNPYKIYKRHAYDVHPSLNPFETTGLSDNWLTLDMKFPHCKPVYPKILVHGVNNTAIQIRFENRELGISVGGEQYETTRPSIDFDDDDTLVDTPEKPITIPNSLITNMTGNNQIRIQAVGAVGGEIIVDFEIGVL